MKLRREIIAPFRAIYKNRATLLATTWNEIQLKYVGSAMGWLWLILYPLFYLGTYSFVYTVVFQSRMANYSSIESILVVLSGFIPFLGFTEALATSIPSVTSNSALVKNTMFPVDILPVKSVLFSQCTQVVGLTLLLAALAVTGRLTFYALLLPVAWLFQLMFSAGIGWFVAACNIFFKDLQNIVTLITLLLMMLSPLGYTIDAIPEAMRGFQSFNPMFYLIATYQDILAVGCFPRQNVLFILGGIALVFFYLGYWFYSRIKAVFSDYV